MAIEDLPGELIVPKRDEVVDQYLRDVRIRTPNAQTPDGSLEAADAAVFADQMMPVYYDIKKIGDYVANVNKAGAALDTELQLAGTSRLQASGGSGIVQVFTSTSGGTIFADDEIKDDITGLRFRCLATRLYTNGSFCPVIGIDTGPTTNLEPGRKMSWTHPRPGVNPRALVVQQSDGSGLSGGRNIESDADADTRLQTLRKSPPAAGNDAEIQKAIQECPGITVQQGFTYSGIRGNGTTGVCFTLRPGTPGANRIPNSTQMSNMLAYLIGKYPAETSFLMCSLVNSPVTTVFEITWSQQAKSWVDASPWPAYIPNDMVIIDAASTPTATSFRLTTATTTTTPKIGQTIAFYDQVNALFRQKAILSVSEVVAGKSWDLAIDTTNNVSDIDYIPYVGQAACPWSESLQTLPTSVTQAFDILGPGEQLLILPDPNLRQHRSPRSPASYPSIVTNRVVTPIFDIASVEDVEMVSPDVPYSTPVGAPGIASYLFSLKNIVAFPQQ